MRPLSHCDLCLIIEHTGAAYDNITITKYKLATIEDATDAMNNIMKHADPVGDWDINVHHIKVGADYGYYMINDQLTFADVVHACSNDISPIDKIHLVIKANFHTGLIDKDTVISLADDVIEKATIKTRS